MTPMQQDQQNQPVAPPPPTPGGKPPMNPRANGALLLGLGVVLEGINGATLVNDNTFYPKLLIGGAALMPLGLWTLATGISYDKNNPVKPPAWWTAGAVGVTIVGLVIGIAVMIWLQE